MEICYQGCGEKKQVFLQSFNIPKFNNGCRFINSGEAIYFVILMWEWY